MVVIFNQGEMRLTQPSLLRQGALRSPGQHEGAEGLDSRAAPGVFPVSWVPLGAAGALAPPAAYGSRAGFAAEGEDGAGAGWAGGRTPQMGARRSQAQAARFLRLEREAGAPPYAARSPAGCDQEVNKRTFATPHKVCEEVSKKETWNHFEPCDVQVSLPRRAEE